MHPKLSYHAWVHLNDVDCMLVKTRSMMYNVNVKTDSNAFLIKLISTIQQWNKN